MLNHASSVVAFSPPPALLAGDGGLLDLAEPVEDTRVILIGADTLELMCALVRRGCASAATVRLGERCDAHAAEIAIVPHLDSPACAETAVAQARRALVPLGSLVVRLAHDRYGIVATAAEMALRRHGFSAIRRTMLGSDLVFTAELPLYGQLAAA